jgi:hypothetical protein
LIPTVLFRVRGLEMPLQDVMLTNWRPRIHPLLNWVQNLTRLRGITIGFSFMWVINRLEISLNIVGTRFPTICLKRAVCCMDSPLPLTMSMSQEIWTVPTTSPNARLYIGYNQPQAGSPQAVQVVSSGAQVSLQMVFIVKSFNLAPVEHYFWKSRDHSAYQ